MIQKKICMVGDFSVGKTSLVSRFVRQTFSDKYMTTVGVKIDSKMVNLLDGQEVKLILWDIAGNDSLTTTTQSYLRGAAGYLLISDSTRLPTWYSAIDLHHAVQQTVGEKPCILLLNKLDLRQQLEITKPLVIEQRRQGLTVLASSAKTGQGVEQAFKLLSQKMLT